jgi:hypothetical protein
MMQLVDEPCALADNRMKPSGPLAEDTHLVGDGSHAGGPLGDGETSGGAGLDRIGLLTAEDGDSVVLVTLRIAARNGDWQRFGEALEEVDQVVGVLSGDIDAGNEANGAMALETCVAAGDEFESSTELFVSLGRLGESEFVGGGLKIVAQESGVMAIARHVDADAKYAFGA